MRECSYSVPPRTQETDPQRSQPDHGVMRKSRPFGFISGLFSLRRPSRLGSEDLSEAPAGRGALPDDSPLLEDSPEELHNARLAAERGDPVAQNRLGLQFVLGPGLLRSEAEACKWLRRAAEQGHAEAQFNLGNLYLSASMRHLNPAVGEARIEAYRWFHLAAGQGHHPARASCETLNLQLTDAELDEGNRRARTFRSQKEAPGRAGA